VADLEHQIGKPIEALDEGIELKLVSKRLAKLREQGLRSGEELLVRLPVLGDAPRKAEASQPTVPARTQRSPEPSAAGCSSATRSLLRRRSRDARFAPRNGGAPARYGLPAEAPG
jgi:hypothetical protein